MEPRCNHLGNALLPLLVPDRERASMEPRCNHLGNAERGGGAELVGGASMEPRCNHLGNEPAEAQPEAKAPPQWSPGVITWETR